MTANFVRLIRCWWPSALTVLLVLWLTLAPDPTPDVQLPSFFGPYGDKIVHAIMMGGITGALVFDYKRRQPGAPRRLTVSFVVWLAVAMLAFSFADEWAQGAMGLGRSTDMWDFAADAVGTGIALIAAPPVVNGLLGRVSGRH